MTTVFKALSERQVKPYKEPLPTSGHRVSLRKLIFIMSACTLALSGCAQTPVGPATNASASSSAPSMVMGGQEKTMGQMDVHMKMMRETHDKMMQAKSPEERQALMATHMKHMQDGMAMMGGKGSGGMSDMQGKAPMAGDLAARQQMMEKRMEMMQTMMHMMMMDRMSQSPSKQ